MISAKLISPDSTLNVFSEIDSLNFNPGENVTVAVRLFSEIRGTRYVPGASATLTLTFTNKDGTSLVKNATVIDSGDRSMWSVDLSQAETADLGGSNILVSLDTQGDATEIWLAKIGGAMIRVNLTSGDC